jgi:hypothetical protein
MILLLFQEVQIASVLKKHQIIWFFVLIIESDCKYAKYFLSGGGKE